MDFVKYSKTEVSGGVQLWAMGRSVRTPAYLAVGSDVRTLYVRYDGAGLSYGADMPAFSGFVPLPRAYPAAVGAFERDRNLSAVSVTVGDQNVQMEASLPTGARLEYPWPFWWDGMTDYISSSFLYDRPVSAGLPPLVDGLSYTMSWFTPDGRRLGLPAAALSSTVSLKSDYTANGESVNCFCYCPNAEMAYGTYPVPTDCADSLYTIFASPCIFLNTNRYDEVKSVEIATLGDNVYAVVTISTRLYNNIL